ncbi:hypothetical protein ASG43_03165 [Aureimonas sp. Leaf454]|uniref:hypothetical protein n=1 Tax=Aureimonas sp. Leaf454 TaxID=1736381 RepID=UPI0006F7706E|nr:hypothetical protein [Aureimonas sp. Leaf454]KQT54599.1 hypothetical protein ASG43_03165 [Aureimonas sp. Leaf454]
MPSRLPISSYDPDEDDRAHSADVIELVAIGINAVVVRAQSRTDAFRRWRRSSDRTRAERLAEAEGGLRFACLNH